MGTRLAIILLHKAIVSCQDGLIMRQYDLYVCSHGIRPAANHIYIIGTSTIEQ